MVTLGSNLRNAGHSYTTAHGSRVVAHLLKRRGQCTTPAPWQAPATCCHGCITAPRSNTSALHLLGGFVIRITVRV